MMDLCEGRIRSAAANNLNLLSISVEPRRLLHTSTYLKPFYLAYKLFMSEYLPFII